MEFQKDVIERSETKPVLVDFWAPWCGPCKMLGPILDQIAEEQIDRFDLIKVNTEEHPGIAQEYGIYSIPNVKLFHHGSPIQEFSGAMSKRYIMDWLDKHLPTADQEELAYLLSKVESLPDKVFIQKASLWLQDNPDNDEGRIALAKHLVFTKPHDVQELLQGMRQGDPYFEEASQVHTLAELSLMDLSDNNPTAGKLLEAQEALAKLDLNDAAQAIIDAVSLDKNYLDELPRRAGIALFSLLGMHHPVTQEYRRLFDMMLW